LLDNAEKVDELFQIWRRREKLEPKPDTLRSQFNDLLLIRTYFPKKVEKCVQKLGKDGISSPWLNSITDEEFLKFIWF
jgi:hypothetical protein